jgi:hypothetical protein
MNIMPDPQIIHSPSGDELVVLSRAEYDEMVARLSDAEEDQADAATYIAAKAALAAGTSFLLPAEVSAFILKGDSLLRATRRWRGVSQAHIAEVTGIGQGYLSDLENRRRSGTPETMEKIAKALGVDEKWFA